MTSEKLLEHSRLPLAWHGISGSCSALLSPIRVQRSTARSVRRRPDFVRISGRPRRPHSRAMRYWNMAQQRYYRRLARIGKTLRVSADPVAKPAALTRAESRDLDQRSIAATNARGLPNRVKDGPIPSASTLKVQRSAVGSGSGRHELARPMSQLGRELSLRDPRRRYLVPLATILTRRLRHCSSTLDDSRVER